MDYVIRGLPLAAFQSLFGQDEPTLRRNDAIRVVADAKPGYPCRITLQDAEPGESLLLLNWRHQDAETPYRADGPIFVRESAQATFSARNQIPEQQRSRLLSVRAYDASGWMQAADVTEGVGLESVIAELLANPSVDYLHVHNARRGCYACRIERA